MLLTCNSCKHQWEDDIEEERTSVWCVRCSNQMPVALALNPAMARSTPPPATQKPAAPRGTQPATEIINERTAASPDLSFGSTPTSFGKNDVPFDEAVTTPPEPRPAPQRKPVAQTVGKPAVKPVAQPAAKPAAASAPERHEKPGARGADALIGKTIDGYRIEKLLGAGGMGAVYLAHQISLDRGVAIKVLPSRFADNAELVARFTREALSAAQLTHHNIIQVYDVGSAESVNYISMEYVRGESLGVIIRRDGRLTIDTAAGYILQAARGLKYAHDHGIIHRDIKPDNMMLNEQGIVKIADMGLAKRLGEAEIPSSPRAPSAPPQPRGPQDMELTGADMAMGTPAYMAPEQARDSRSVDARADQYSLGCALYYLCAGKAPYSGTTAFELISKHMREPLTPLDVHVRGVPPTFGRIIERMLAKEPDDRYPTTGDVIKDLEAYLGVDSEKGPYTPREQHVAVLEGAQKDYYAVPSIKKRRMAVTAFFALMPVLFLGSIFARMFPVAAGILGLLVLTPVANFILDGIVTKTYLFRRVRSLFFKMPLRSWLMTVAGTVLGLGALYVTGLLMPWLAFAVLAVGLAATYQWGVARPLRGERGIFLARTQDMLKELRIRGVSEEALQDFVCRFSGVNWEEYYEDLFGYEAMVLARSKWAAADKVKPRKKFATWRDPLARWLDSVEESRKLAREKKQLAKVEAKRLKAAGATEADANRQAAEAATAIMKEGLGKKPKKEKSSDDDSPFLTITKKRSGLEKALLALRSLFGVAILGAYGATFVAGSLPGPIASLLSDHYYGWGWGGNPVAIFAGLAVVAMALTRRSLAPWLVTLGAILLIFQVPIVNLAAQPQFTTGIATVGGLLFIALGIGPAIMAKFTGGRF